MTPTGPTSKRRLGANAIVGTSMAVARAMAIAEATPLYRWLAPDQPLRLPVPHFNVIKLNEIGSVSETLEAMAVCRDAGYAQMVSHRSGGTSDTFIADLAVATGCGQLKAGAPARGERVAKDNRLLTIEAELGGTAPYGAGGARPA